MKINILLFTILTSLLPFVTNAQQSGIYKTANDFKEGRLFTADSHRRLKLHTFIKRSFVELVHKDSNYVFEKDRIYGYCYRGSIYRLFNGCAFEVLNPTEPLLLYRVTTGTGAKNSPVTEAFFFSRDAWTDPQPLSLANVLLVFSDHSAFCKVLEIYCRSDADLLIYDKVHRQYKLNRLLKITETI